MRACSCSFRRISFCQVILVPAIVEVVMTIGADTGIRRAKMHLVLMHLVAGDVAPYAVDNDFVLGEEVVLNFEQKKPIGLGSRSAPIRPYRNGADQHDERVFWRKTSRKRKRPPTEAASFRLAIAPYFCVGAGGEGAVVLAAGGAVVVVVPKPPYP